MCGGASSADGEALARVAVVGPGGDQRKGTSRRCGDVMAALDRNARARHGPGGGTAMIEADSTDFDGRGQGHRQGMDSGGWARARASGAFRAWSTRRSGAGRRCLAGSRQAGLAALADAAAMSADRYGA